MTSSDLVDIDDGIGLDAPALGAPGRRVGDGDQPPPLGDRLNAFLIDQLMVGAILMIWIAKRGDLPLIPVPIGAVMIPIAVAVGVWNLVVRQGNGGQSVGKGLKNLYLVRTADASPIGWSLALVRALLSNVLGVVTVGAYWVVEGVVMATRPDRRRLLDQLLGLNVVSRSAGMRKARRKEGLLAIIVPPLVLSAVLIGGWYIVSYGVLSARRRFLLQPPHRVFEDGVLGNEFDDMLKALWATTKVAYLGLVVAIVLGLLLATVMSQTKLVERAAFPYLVMLQAIPILAIVPLIGFWWGFGQTSRIIVCVIIALFPLVVNPLFGLQSAERSMHDLFSLHGASRVTRLRKLMFPAAMPAIFAGLRIAAGLSVIGAIVGDFLFGRGEQGIGKLLQRYANNLDGEELLTAVFLSSAIGVAVFLMFGWLQNQVIGKWYQSGQHTE
jgi:NitT/TauT family transport system permease protein